MRPEGVKERLERYLKITGEALESVEAVDLEGEKILDMARRYYEDAKYYYWKGDFLTSFVSVVYAHAWLDVGSYLGHLKSDREDLLMVGR